MESILHLLFLLQFLPLLSSSESYNPQVKYFMNCGSDSNVDLGDLRNFVGDKNSNASFYVGKSTPVQNENPSPGISPLYHTARIFTKITRYMLNITQTGSYLVRLHFFPFSFKTTHLADALFSVSASNFSLLSNFSVGNSSTGFPVIKEFFLTIAEGNFDIYFIPADETRFAFVNAIEAFLLPPNFFNDSLITPIPPLLSIDGALRTLYRIDVGGDQKVNDTLWRTWVPDNDYLTFPSSVTASSYDGELQKSSQRLVVNEIAPDAVYKTYKKVIIDNNRSSNFPNITWRFNVSKEARHLVRLHVCDLVSESPGTVKFDLNISPKFSEVIDPNANGFSEMRIPLFYDYVVSSDDSGYMSFSIAPNKTSIMKVAFLNGLEIMEFVGNSTFEMPVEHEKRKHPALMIGSAGGVALILVLILSLSLCLWLRRRKTVEALILKNEFVYGRGRSPSSATKRTENAKKKMSEERNIEHQHGRDYYHDPPPAPLLDMAELKRWSFYRATIAEFIATLLFLFLAVSTVVNYKEPNYTDQCSRVGYLGIALAYGGVIFVLVYCATGISGGHLNPAVTFGMLLARKMSLIRAAAYMVAQCLGALFGVFFVICFTNSDEQQNSEGVVNEVTSNYSKGAGLTAEFIGTFVLVYTVFSATDPKRNARDSHVPVLSPLPIGFAVFVVHLAIIPITGTGINPARSLGTNLIYRSHTEAMDDLWIFWVGPFLGALAAAVYHKYILRAGAVKTLKSFRASGSSGGQLPV